MSLSPLAGATRVSTAQETGPAARSIAIAILAGPAAFVVTTTLETLVIQSVHGNRAQLEWISDVLGSLGIMALSYLWLHLRESRMRLLALEREQVAVNEQLRLAAEIQWSALPRVPVATPGFHWAARMIPAGRVGGDLYDFCSPAPDVAIVIVADVSGKGIPAALLLSAVKTLFRTIVKATTDPAVIAARLSEALFEEHGGTPYVTAIIARFEGAPPLVAYVNAGHPFGYLVREGETRTLPPDGPPLGLLSEARYVTASEDLRPGDFGVFVTDGVTEALETGPTTLRQAVSRARAVAGSERPLSAACDALLEAAASGGGPVGADGWQDDRTAFVFTVDARPGDGQPARL
jgi:serine phosphatase RsbU (regulator of sigma subunit)